MNSSQALVIGVTVSVILACSGCVGGGSNAQTFETNWGKVQIKIPQKVSVTSVEGGNSISIVKEGSFSPLITISISELSQNFDISGLSIMGGKVNTAITDDNHKIYWYVTSLGFKQYHAYIDYTADKNLLISFIVIPVYADTASGKIITAFEEEDVLSILKSFTFVGSDGKSQSTQSTETAQVPTFHMAVIGDSVAWGNGLNKEDKYPYLVADWLEEKLNRPVDVTVYAHSGATISGESGEAIDQNLNSESPTLMDQAKNIKDKDDVDLILISGGINDVGIMNILNAYIPSDKIDQNAQSIQEPMKNLLSTLLNECKNAKIIVTNYYPIVSEDSDIKTIEVLYGLGVFFINDVTNKNALDAFTAKEKLIENSYMFNGGSLMALTGAVRDANNGAKRVTLAMVNFQPENCYAASQTWLWKLEGLGTNDDQFAYRSSLTSDPIK